MKSFEEMGIVPEILKGIDELGFKDPMPIQEKVIPMLLEKKEDLIGLAQTGTGKTAAFGLPIIQLADQENKSTQALILAPTRELCMQIAGDLKNYAKYLPEVYIVAIYGGADMQRQIRALKKGAQIIVATPGRMNDLLNRRKKIDLSCLETVVLDEADEMLNMGFKEELDAILDQTPDTKKTLLFSATMPKEVQEISKNYMNNPSEIAVGARDSGAENVEHLCYTVRSKDRYLALKRIVDYNPKIYGIIFCQTRIETKDIADKLIQDGYNADALHGDLSQTQRELIMHKFRIKNLQMLVATDVAARGLDVKDISHVINYNLPHDNLIYTHRSGRTGRAGKKGISIAIVNLKEKYKLKQIESKLKKKFELKSIPGGKEICEKQVLNFVDKMDKIEVDHYEIDKFLPKVYEKLEWMNREELIKHFVSLEFNRFLDYYKDAVDLSTPETREERRKSRKKPPPGQRYEGDAVEMGFTRFFINLGFKDGMAPRDLIGLINRRTRNNRIAIGKITLMKKFSFFEIEQKYASLIIKSFNGIEYKNREVIVEVSTGEERPPVDFHLQKKRKTKSDRRRARRRKKLI